MQSGLTLPWTKGPALGGNHPCDDGTVEVGDRFLIAVPVVCRLSNRTYWETSVIVAAEDGWDDVEGDTWGAWDWSDVSWYIRLDRAALPPL